MNAVIIPNLKVTINGIVPHRMIIGTSIVTPNCLQGTIIPVGRTFTVPVCPQTEKEITSNSLKGEGLYCNPNLTIDEVIALLEKVFEHNPSNNLYVPLNYSFLEFGTNLIITKSDAGFTVKLTVLGAEEDILIENSQFTNAYQTLVIESAEQFGKPANFIRTLMYSYVQNTEPVSVTCETTYNETNVGEYNELLKDWISYIPFTQIEGEKIELNGEYDGSTYTTRKTEINLKELINEMKIPLRVNVELSEEKPIGWADVVDSLDDASPTIVYRYLAKNNRDLYMTCSKISYSDPTYPIYYANLETGELKEIVKAKSAHPLSLFFEDSNGNIFTSGGRYGGTCYLLKDGKATLVYDGGGTVSNFKETSKGYVYVVPQTNQVYDFLFFNGESFEKLNSVNINGYTYTLDLEEGLYFNKILEDDSKGLCLINGNVVTNIISGIEVSTNRCVKTSEYLYLYFDNGLQCLDRKNPTNYTKVYDTTFSQWLQYSIEDKEGNLYLYSGFSSNPGMIMLDKNNPAITLFEQGNSFTFFKDYYDNTYFYHNNSSILGIYKLANPLVQLHDSGYNWRYSYENTKTKEIYLSSDNSSSNGLLKINNGTIETIISNGYGYTSFVEDSEGDLYISGGSNTASGIHKIIDGVYHKIYEYMNNWIYFYEDKKGNKYMQSSAYSPIVEVSGTEGYGLGTTAYYFRTLYEDSKGDLYVNNAAQTGGDPSYIGLFYLNGKTKAVKVAEGSFAGYAKCFFESNGKTYAAETESPEYGKLVYELNPTKAIAKIYIKDKGEE